MPPETIFRLIAIVFSVTLFGTSGYFRRRADRQAGALRTSEGQRAVALIRLLMLGALLPVLAYFINPDWVVWARLPLPAAVRWLGVALAAIALPLGYWVLSSIGNNISPTQATRHNHQLVTHGPYRFVRHPLYSVGLLAYTALALITAMWWILIGVLPAIVFLLWRTPHEEARLIETFGDAYRAYARRTGRFVPRLF
jgi:protein-S-isoprenylcysteine O-methyltransferase Ste14